MSEASDATKEIDYDQAAFNRLEALNKSTLLAGSRVAFPIVQFDDYTGAMLKTVPGLTGGDRKLAGHMADLRGTVYTGNPNDDRTRRRTARLAIASTLIQHIENSITGTTAYTSGVATVETLSELHFALQRAESTFDTLVKQHIGDDGADAAVRFLAEEDEIMTLLAVLRSIVTLLDENNLEEIDTKLTAAVNETRQMLSETVNAVLVLRQAAINANEPDKENAVQSFVELIKNIRSASGTLLKGLTGMISSAMTRRSQQLDRIRNNAMTSKDKALIGVLQKVVAKQSMQGEESIVLAVDITHPMFESTMASLQSQNPVVPIPIETETDKHMIYLVSEGITTAEALEQRYGDQNVIGSGTGLNSTVDEQLFIGDLDSDLLRQIELVNKLVELELDVNMWQLLSNERLSSFVLRLFNATNENKNMSLLEPLKSILNKDESI
uniref:Uncharacterized protein n=1 Tax=viral metagenome TaxID=1070528 RepID=A0A2V0RIZ0_9ZZZZ